MQYGSSSTSGPLSCHGANRRCILQPSASLLHLVDAPVQDHIRPDAGKPDAGVDAVGVEEHLAVEHFAKVRDGEARM